MGSFKEKKLLILVRSKYSAQCSRYQEIFQSVWGKQAGLPALCGCWRCWFQPSHGVFALALCRFLLG